MTSSGSAIVVALWVLFLVGAVFYTRRARHPAVQALAAYLIFVTIFTVTAFVLFTTGLFLMRLAGWTAPLFEPTTAALFLLLVFVPAFLLARWQLRRPPRRRRHLP